ncbi:hypothetical protein [Saccharopolyspora gloriosae]|uniref:hypothetical protein n=1 Tax=Saccharopolyspora gloriosae TaxID=455344 RepID=UPI001FB6A8B0|nr:hypothetical protein [Saccharopolyspora gloriosae]
MQLSKFAKTAATAGIMLGLSALAAPAALADGYVTNNQDGTNVGVHQSGVNGNGAGNGSKAGYHKGLPVSDFVAGKIAG